MPKDVGDRGFEGFDSPGGGFAEVRFEFGISVLDRVEIGRIGQQQEAGAAGLDRRPYGGTFMCRRIVHHDNVAGIESGVVHVRVGTRKDVLWSNRVRCEGPERLPIEFRTACGMTGPARVQY
jgi:hypothetical protein